MTLESSDDKLKKMQLSKATSHKACQKLSIQKLCWRHKILISAVIAVMLEEHSLLLMIGIHHLLTNSKLKNHHSTTTLSTRTMTLVLLLPDMSESFLPRMVFCKRYLIWLKYHVKEDFTISSWLSSLQRHQIHTLQYCL